VFNCCVVIVCEMEACTEHLVHFKQHAITEFLTAKGVSPIEIHHRMHIVYCDDCIDVSTAHPGHEWLPDTLAGGR
jgi:hypothetical protein